MFLLHGNTRERLAKAAVLLAAPLSFAGTAHADCTAPRTADIASDTTFTGSEYIGGHIRIKDGATLTMEAGAELVFCGEYQLRVGGTFNQGTLIVNGEPGNPVVMRADDPTTNWWRLYIHKSTTDTSLRHLVVRDSGGNDPTAGNGAIVLNTPDTPDTIDAVLDHVTIEDSGGIGLLWTGAVDATPPSVSNITITDSAAAAMEATATELSGLGGENSYSGNNPNRINVPGNSEVNYSPTWQAEPIPYAVMGDLRVKSEGVGGDGVSVMTIEAGATVQLAQDVSINVGSLYGDGGLVVEGEAGNPVNFEPLVPGEAWDRIAFDASFVQPPGARLNHAEISGAGSGGAGSIAMFNGGSALTLRHVTITDSASAAVDVNDSALFVQSSTFTGNAKGIEVDAADTSIRNSVFDNNTDAAVSNLTPATHCVEAVGNYWGAADGPMDGVGTADACDQGGSNAGTGESVTGGVQYRPWLADADGTPTDRSSISPAESWVVANGQRSTELTVTVRDAQGRPLSGKTVELETSLGTLTQPTSPTGDDGVTTARIQSAETGTAFITARNTTDDTRLSAQSMLEFWSGADSLGLIDPSGAPYSSPDLKVTGKPFEQGRPIGLAMPLNNANSDAVEVTVEYGASGLNIGDAFTPVATVSRTLEPGESWDAAAEWTPSVTGHHCIQATVTRTAASTSIATAASSSLVPTANGDSVTRQQNLDVGSSGADDGYPGINGQDNGPCGFFCYTPSLKKGGPSPLGWLSGQFNNMAGIARENGDYMNDQLSYDPPNHDYDEVVALPRVALPAVDGTGMDQAQYEAMQAYRSAVETAVANGEAVGLTMDRLTGALTADEHAYASRQHAALREFLRGHATGMEDMAAAVDDLLAATRGAGVAEPVIAAQDYADFLARLKSTGFNQAETDYLQQAGLSSAEIQDVLDNEIANLESADGRFRPVGAYEALEALRDAYAAQAQAIFDHHGRTEGATIAAAAQTSGDPELLPGGPMTAEFTVGNPKGSEKTVELRVRPVDMPSHWSYSLSDARPRLAAGDSKTVTLTIDPGDKLVENTTARVAIEGYIDDEIVGGVVVKRTTPIYTASSDDPLPELSDSDDSSGDEDAGGDSGSDGGGGSGGGGAVGHGLMGLLLLASWMRRRRE